MIVDADKVSKYPLLIQKTSYTLSEYFRLTLSSNAVKLRVIGTPIDSTLYQFKIKTWMHPEIMRSMNASDAGAIEIKGTKRAAARCFSFNDTKLKECLKVMPSEEADRVNQEFDHGNRQDVIMMNPLVRNNAGVTIGDYVRVRKVDAIPAKYVVQAPLTEVVGGGRLYFVDVEGIGGIPVVRGNDTSVQSFDEADGTLYRVIETLPSTDDGEIIVRIDESTRILTLDKVMPVPIPEPNNLPKEWYRRNSYRVKFSVGGGYQAINEDKGHLSLNLDLTYRNSDHYDLIRIVDRSKIDYEDQRKLMHLCQEAGSEIVRDINEKLKNNPVPRLYDDDSDNATGSRFPHAGLIDFYDMELTRVKYEIIKHWNEIIDSF